MTSNPKTFKFIGCEIIYREACHLAAVSPHRIDVEFLQKGLHDLDTGDMRSTIQAAIDLVGAEPHAYDAVLLGYARCNDGLAGIEARDVPLIIPRAHDCITFFFGSRAAYKDYFDAHPGTYYETTGWVERNNSGEGQIDRPAYGRRGVMSKLGLTETYEQMVAKHGRENADYIIETLGGWEKAYSNLCYIDMGVMDEAALIAVAREKADDRGWSFDLRKGDMSLLEKLFSGEWDDDFLIVRPGWKIVERNDDRILDVEEI